MENVHDGLDVKNSFNLVLKEIYVKCGRKNRITQRDVFKKYDNLSENELNSKSNKEVYVTNDAITSVIVHCRGKKKSKIQKGIQNLIIWYSVNT